VARAAHEAGARVVGISAKQVQKAEGTCPQGFSEWVVAESMHSRRIAMFERSDAFIALPGGMGTLEELTEVWSWKHLGLHRKPLAFLNVNGFWNPFLDFVQSLVADGLARSNHELDPMVYSDPQQLVEALRHAN
jgi:uncharacterized protein (TIGR00730 family)